ncbi:MAG TPA: L-seryl-tRNA(Sec) selenium transferase [Actinomycetota bacterium]
MRSSDERRDLPQVDEVLRRLGDAGAGPLVARWVVRREIDAARARILAGERRGDVEGAARLRLKTLTERRVRAVVNATGVVLHTNLGRARLSAEARVAIAHAAGAAAVEFDVATGERAERAPVAATLAAALVDAPAALVVNNNAGALLLALAALARGREVVVGRGEMIEIGGSFRLPDVMEASGAVLREVGTTNRTHLKDYEGAVSDRTALVLKVHPSNYKVEGFATTPSVAELTTLTRAAGLPLLNDIGSGLLAPEEGVFADEPDATTALAAGADLVCFSGDKLLGGPQAGILAGREDLVERCRTHPIARAVRAGKLALAALEATLWAHARGERDTLPTWQMLHATPGEVRARAEAVAEGLPHARVVDGESVAGGGALPGVTIPSALIRIDHVAPGKLARALRSGTPPIVARLDAGGVLIDLRTVDPGDDDLVAAALAGALSEQH